MRAENVDYTTKTEYDALNRKTAVTTALGLPEERKQIFEYGIRTATEYFEGDDKRQVDKTYDVFGHLIKQVEFADTPAQKTSTFEYEVFGRLSEEVVSGSDVDSITTTYSYNDAGQMIGRSEGNNSIQARYNGFGDLIEYEDEAGRVTKNDYNNLGQVIQTIVGAQADDAITYDLDLDGFGQITKETSSLRTREFDYDALGRSTSERIVAGETTAETKWTYDSFGRMLTLTDPNGNETKLEYNELGFLSRSTDALNRVALTEYDSAGRLRKSTGPDGRVAEYTYDAHGNQLTTKDTVEGQTRTISQSFSNLGLLESATDALNRSVSFTYDAAGRTSTTTDADGVEASSLFDALGHLTELKKPGFADTIYEPGATGQPVSISTEGFSDRTIMYHESGLPEEITDDRGTTKYTFTSHGQVETVSLPAGGQVEFTYQPEGPVETIMDAAGNVRTFAYDGMGYLDSITNASGDIVRFDYDLVGNQISHSYEGGTRIDRTLNGVHLAELEEWFGTDETRTNTVSTTYTLFDRVDVVGDSFATLDHDYDSGRRLEALTRTMEGIADAKVEYDYNLSDQLTQEIVKLGDDVLSTTDYGYDNAGRIETISFDTGSSDVDVVYAYHEDSGLLKSVDRSIDGQLASKTLYEYDGRGQVESIEHQDGSGAVVESFVYDRYSDGRVRTLTTSTGTETYDYDAGGQLLSVDYSDPSRVDESYTYDFAGNRITSHNHGSSYETELDNRIQADSRYTYTYDVAGNIETRFDTQESVTRTYTWDARQRLVRVRDTQAGQEILDAEFQYDALNRRIVSIVDTSEQDPVWTYYMHSTDEVVAELVDPDGPIGPAPPTVANQRLTGLATDEFLAGIDGEGKVVIPLMDQLRSVRAAIHQDGEIAVVEFDAYGNPEDELPFDLSHSYTGREYDDATGLYYLRNRFYDPSIGRFLSPDPSGYDGLDENLYRYVGNDPINAIDPTGLTAEDVAVAQYRQNVAAFQQMYGVSPAATEAFVEGLERIDKGFSPGNAWTNPSTSWGDLFFEAGNGLVRAGATAVQELGLLAYDALGEIASGISVAGVMSYELLTRQYVNNDYIYLHESRGSIAQGLGKLNEMNQAGFSDSFMGQIGKSTIAPAKTALQAGAGIITGILGIPANIGGGLLTGDFERFGQGTFDLLTLASPAKTVSGIRGIGSGFTAVRSSVRGVTPRNFVQQVGAAAKSSPTVRFTKAIRPVTGDFLTTFSNTGVELVRLAFDPSLADDVQTAITRASKMLEKEGLVLLDDTQRKLTFASKALATIGRVHNPLKYWYPKVDTIADAVNPLDFKSKKFGFGAILDLGRRMAKRDLAQLKRAELIETLPKGSTFLKELDQAKLAGANARDTLFRFANSQNPIVRTGARELITLIEKHQFSLPAVWEKTVARINSEVRTADDLIKVFESPFFKGTERSIVEVVFKKFYEHGGKHSGLKPGEVMGLTARGTGGASLGQIDYRGDFVNSVLAGEKTQLLMQFAGYRAGWRFIADLYKTPYGSLSDIDLSISIRGGGERLTKLQGSSKGSVLFPTFDEANKLYYAGVVQDMVEIVQSAVKAGELPESALKFIQNKKLDPPLEIYYHDTPELATWTTEADLGNPLRKGGITFTGDANTIKVLTNRSTFFEANPNSIQVSSIVGYGIRKSGFIGREDGFLLTELTSESTTPSTVTQLMVGANPIAWEPNNAAVAEILTFAIEQWTSWTGLPAIDVEFEIEELPPRQLAVAYRDADDQGRQRGRIILDDDAAGYGWYVAATPSAVDATKLPDEAASNYDLQTVVLHELGHLYGFTSNNPEFADAMEVLGGQAVLHTPLQTLNLDHTGNELDPASHPNALMAATLRPGVRKSLTVEDAAAFSLLGPWTVTTSQFGGNQHQELGGFVLLADAVHDDFADLPTGLSSAFEEWNQINVTLDANTATLREGNGLVADLSQTFVLPAGAQSIDVTISGVTLEHESNLPPDAFEISLLDANSAESLFNEFELTGSDALLSLQADGEIFFSEGVTTSAQVESGGTIDITQPLDVSIKLPKGLAEETVATIYFDLVGFADDESEVSLSKPRIETDDVVEVPSITLDLAAESDSGLPDDRVTQNSLVAIEGTTSPNTTVVLDVDGNGFDDGTATADESGKFRFSDVGLVEGQNLVSAQVQNEAGTSTAGLTILVDLQSPVSELSSPAPKSTVSGDLGYVDLRWSDQGLAGIEIVSIDPADVVIAGLDVERVESQGDDVYRYFYGDDGDSLVEGEVAVQVLGGSVRDLAGNENTESAFTFVYSPSNVDLEPPVAELIFPVPGSNVAEDTGYVDVRWADAGASTLDEATIDVTDVVISNVGVDRVVAQSDGVYRYYYGDDGEILVVGDVSVRIIDAAVADTSGNASTQADFEFVLVQQPAAADAVFFVPTPYLSADDTPLGFLNNCEACTVRLEDFEDDAIDSELKVGPGEIVLPGASSGTPRITDSVDGDDGVIDGTGQTGAGGHSFYNIANTITVEFEPQVTAAGLVWTDGDTRLTNVVFEAFDQDGTSLGVIEGSDLSDDVFTGTTAEDRFFGVQYGDGESSWISSIEITNVGGRGIEIDHIQYEYIAGPLFGDVNRDGIVDVTDIDAITNAVRNESEEPVFDLTADNKVDAEDRDRLLSELRVRVGDVDLNGTVDFNDFLLLSHHFGQTDVGWSQGNFDFDADVTFDDFSFLRTSYVENADQATARLSQSEPLNSIPFYAMDTSGDGHLSSLDVLHIVNFLNAPSDTVATPYHLDVERDGLITARDALIVINELNRRSDVRGSTSQWETETDDFFASDLDELDEEVL